MVIFEFVSGINTHEYKTKVIVLALQTKQRMLKRRCPKHVTKGAKEGSGSICNTSPKGKIQCCPQLVLYSVYAKLESVHVNSYEVIHYVATINRGIVPLYRRLDACTLCGTSPHRKL